VRAAISAEADQVEGLRALGELGRQVVLEQHDRRPVPAGKRGPDMPGRLGDAGARAGPCDLNEVEIKWLETIQRPVHSGLIEVGDERRVHAVGFDRESIEPLAGHCAQAAPMKIR